MSNTTDTSSKRRRKPGRVLLRQLMALLSAGSDVRRRKVRRLRGAVRARRYENDLKLSIAVDRMMENL
ncbi:MAG TPA: hypothetical protein VG326_08365 [Tepidisphaeraceae bacterium]|jgi:hypothetical protein|nr:hypothetical protein [Tepidisphaeraceae bacterium]